jgi:hypothetical protein
VTWILGFVQHELSHIKEYGFEIMFVDGLGEEKNIVPEEY